MHPQLGRRLGRRCARRRGQRGDPQRDAERRRDLGGGRALRRERQAIGGLLASNKVRRHALAYIAHDDGYVTSGAGVADRRRDAEHAGHAPRRPTAAVSQTAAASTSSQTVSLTRGVNVQLAPGYGAETTRPAPRVAAIRRSRGHQRQARGRLRRAGLLRRLDERAAERRARARAPRRADAVLRERGPRRTGRARSRRSTRRHGDRLERLHRGGTPGATSTCGWAATSARRNLGTQNYGAGLAADLRRRGSRAARLEDARHGRHRQGRRPTTQASTAPPAPSTATSARARRPTSAARTTPRHRELEEARRHPGATYRYVGCRGLARPERPGLLEHVAVAEDRRHAGRDVSLPRDHRLRRPEHPGLHRHVDAGR